MSGVVVVFSLIWPQKPLIDVDDIVRLQRSAQRLRTGKAQLMKQYTDEVLKSISERNHNVSTCGSRFLVGPALK